MSSSSTALHMLPFLLTILLYYSISVSPIHCFCIYNKHADSTVIDIFQTGGHLPITLDGSRFSASGLSPGNKQCCNYLNPDCNWDLKSDSILRFGITRKYPDRKEGEFDMDCPAGGFIVFSGDANNPIIEVFNADRSQYNYSFYWRAPSRELSAHHSRIKMNTTRYLSVNNTGQVDHRS